MTKVVSMQQNCSTLEPNGPQLDEAYLIKLLLFLAILVICFHWYPFAEMIQQLLLIFLGALLPLIIPLFQEVNKSEGASNEASKF